MNRPFLLVATRVWLTEILLSGVNYFVLMRLVYEPAWGELVAHQVGMATRVVYIFGFAYLLQRYTPTTPPGIWFMPASCGCRWRCSSSGAAAC